MTINFKKSFKDYTKDALIKEIEFVYSTLEEEQKENEQNKKKVEKLESILESIFYACEDYGEYKNSMEEEEVEEGKELFAFSLDELSKIYAIKKDF